MRKWDAFISYKSKDTYVARRIADYLIASGKKVWFAEYQVLLERKQFESQMDKGLHASSYCIALTSDAYAESKYCKTEMNVLLKNCGLENILLVQKPEESKTYEVWPELLGAASHPFSEDVNDILNFIAERTGWEIVPASIIKLPEREREFRGKCLGFQYTIDVSGWELLQKSFYGGGPCYVLSVGEHDLFWNLQFGEEMDPQVYQARSLWSQEKDERTLFNSICKYAVRYFDTYHPSWDVKGVHMLFLDGSNHFSITYYDGKFWKRRYSIMWVHPVLNKAAEFVFTFQFDGSFEQYCHCVFLMDKLVMTLKWKKEPNIFQRFFGSLAKRI